MAEQTFADGFNFEERKDNQPEWILGKISMKVELAKGFLDTYKNEKGYVNIDVKRGQKGNVYLALNTWKPNKDENGNWTPKPQSQEQIDEMKNKAKVEYPTEELKELPF